MKIIKRTDGCYAFSIVAPSFPAKNERKGPRVSCNCARPHTYTTDVRNIYENIDRRRRGAKQHNFLTAVCTRRTRNGSITRTCLANRSLSRGKATFRRWPRLDLKRRFETGQFFVYFSVLLSVLIELASCYSRSNSQFEKTTNARGRVVTIPRSFIYIFFSIRTVAVF